MNVGTLGTQGARALPLFHKFVLKVPLFSLYSALSASKGAAEFLSPHFLNAFYVPGFNNNQYHIAL